VLPHNIEVAYYYDVTSPYVYSSYYLLTEFKYTFAFSASSSKVIGRWLAARGGWSAGRDFWTTEVSRSERWKRATREPTCVGCRIDSVGRRRRRR